MKRPSRLVALDLHVDACLGRHDFAGALQGYRDIIALAPGDPVAHEGMVKVYLLTGRSFDALEILQGLLAANVSPTPGGHKWKANMLALTAAAHCRLGNFPDALEALERALDLQPTSALERQIPRLQLAAKDAKVQRQERLLVRARGLLARKEFAAAMEALRAVLKLRPDHTPTLYGLAVLLYDRKDAVQALPLLLRALQLAPNCATFHNMLGLIHESLASYQEALACFQRALALEPLACHVWLNKGVAHERLGQLDEAAAACNKVLEINPRNAGAHNKLGTLSRLRGDMEGARQHFLRALSLDPDAIAARMNLQTLEGANSTQGVLPSPSGRTQPA